MSLFMNFDDIDHPQDMDTAELFSEKNHWTFLEEANDACQGEERSIPIHRYKQCKLWCMTYNAADTNNSFGHFTKIRDYMTALHDNDFVDWSVGALEWAPTTDTPHVQAACHFKKKQRFNEALAKLDFGMHPHIEQCLGDAKSNRIYCLKLDTPHPNKIFWEFGTLPVDGPTKVKMDWERNLQLARTNHVESCDARLQICHLNNLRTLAFTGTSENIPALDVLDNYWICGPPGVGKSLFVRQTLSVSLVGGMQNVYLKDPRNKWWDLIKRNHTMILFDDLEKTDTHMAHLLKVAADHYPFIAEIKGASQMIRPKHIVITSNYEINDFISTDDVLCSAIKRRFKQIVVKDRKVLEDSWTEAQLGKTLICTNVHEECKQGGSLYNHPWRTGIFNPVAETFVPSSQTIVKNTIIQDDTPSKVYVQDLNNNTIQPLWDAEQDLEIARNLKNNNSQVIS